LRASWVLIVIAHALIAYPFTTRAVLSGARAMSPRLQEAAATLGAPPRTVFRRVLLPLLMPGLIVGAVFAVAVSLGEFGATLVLHRPEHMTLPVLIFRALSRPGPVFLGQALALATLLMLMTIALFIILERFRWKDLGEF
jgi:thiamine transport system permease protein